MKKTTDFESVFACYWSRIHSLLTRMLGDHDEAEDLAIETFLKLHHEPRMLDASENVGGWLYRVALNLGYNALRARRRRLKYEMKAGVSALESHSLGDPIQEAERAVEKAQVRQVLALMKTRNAKMLLLRYSGLTYAEIAETLNLNPASVGKLLSRAEHDFEKKFRHHFDK